MVDEFVQAEVVVENLLLWPVRVESEAVHVSQSVFQMIQESQSLVRRWWLRTQAL